MVEAAVLHHANDYVLNLAGRFGVAGFGAEKRAGGSGSGSGFEESSAVQRVPPKYLLRTIKVYCGFVTAR